jgi:hypothetical protein
MPALPFPFNAAEFHPVQPEEAEREADLRSDPRYAHMYSNVAAARYEAQGESPAQVYQAWVDTCNKMKQETDEAHRAWREAMMERDRQLLILRDKAEELRIAWKKLESRPKPPQPRSTRK